MHSNTQRSITVPTTLQEIFDLCFPEIHTTGSFDVEPLKISLQNASPQKSQALTTHLAEVYYLLQIMMTESNKQFYALLLNAYHTVLHAAVVLCLRTSFTASDREKWIQREKIAYIFRSRRDMVESLEKVIQIVLEAKAAKNVMIRERDLALQGLLNQLVDNLISFTPSFISLANHPQFLTFDHCKWLADIENLTCIDRALNNFEGYEEEKQKFLLKMLNSPEAINTILQNPNLDVSKKVNELLTFNPTIQTPCNGQSPKTLPRRRNTFHARDARPSPRYFSKKKLYTSRRKDIKTSKE
jgi:multisubunit Na+/H+ antiporter MnhE subunit